MGYQGEGKRREGWAEDADGKVRSEERRTEVRGMERSEEGRRGEKR